MKQQAQNSTPSTENKRAKKKTKNETDPNAGQLIVMNLIHILFLHAILLKLYHDDKRPKDYEKILTDLLFLFEYQIDQTKNEDLKSKMNYQPLKSKSTKTK